MQSAERQFERQIDRSVMRGSHRAAFEDNYTRGHCQRVADVACELASDAGFEFRLLHWFRLGALLHDVGKLHVPTEILTKRGPLTPAETEIVRQHPVVGAAMVEQLRLPWDVRPMVRYHHEHWDGSGYPDRLSGRAIPFAARLLTIADVYDAMTSDRPYHAAYSHDAAVRVMAAERGRTFDPELLDTFLRVTLPRVTRNRMRQAPRNLAAVRFAEVA